MSDWSNHRRRVQHFHDPADCHELTFSCYQRMPLLSDDMWRGMLSKSIDRAMVGHGFRLVAFVYMPEHVHLVVYPAASDAKIDELLKAIKRPYSYRIKQLLLADGSPLLQKLTVQDRSSGSVFRFWQKGPGYDRNLTSPATVLASIDYVHKNPVQRGLCATASEWKWSTARAFQQAGSCPDEVFVDNDLPVLHALPAEYLA